MPRSTTRTSRRAYYTRIKFWKTPIADCGNGKNNCMAYTQWRRPGPRSRGSGSAALMSVVETGRAARAARLSVSAASGGARG